MKFYKIPKILSKNFTFLEDNTYALYINFNCFIVNYKTIITYTKLIRYQIKMCIFCIPYIFEQYKSYFNHIK